MIIEYDQGRVRRKIQGHRRVIEKEDDISNETDFVQSVTRAMFSLGDNETKQTLLFNTDDFLVRFNGKIISPDTEINVLPGYVQTFVNAIYNFDDGFYKKQFIETKL